MCVSIPSEYYAGRTPEEEVMRLLDHYEFTSSPWIRIDSNWKLTWILPVFLKRFPDARVLHLSRDPRRNVHSCHSLDFYGTLLRRPEFARRQFWLSWMPEIRRPDWPELSPFERNCAFWAETHRLALQALSDHPNHLHIRLEDLRHRHTRNDLYDFFEVGHPTRIRSALSARQRVNERAAVKAKVRLYKEDNLPEYDQWPAPLRRRLAEICGATAALLGYSL